MTNCDVDSSDREPGNKASTTTTTFAVTVPAEDNMSGRGTLPSEIMPLPLQNVPAVPLIVGTVAAHPEVLAKCQPLQEYLGVKGMEAVARAVTKKVRYSDVMSDDQLLLCDKYVDILLRFITKQLAVETKLPVLPTGRDAATIVGDLSGPEIFTDRNRWQPIFCKGCMAEVYNSQVAHPQPFTSISQIYCCSLCDITDGQCHEIGCGNTCLNQRTCRGPHPPLYAFLVQQDIVPIGYPDELVTCDSQRLHLSKSLVA